MAGFWERVEEGGNSNGVVWCGVVLCSVVWCGVVWCGVVCVLWYSMAWHGNLVDVQVDGDVGDELLEKLCVCVCARVRKAP